MDTLTFTSGAMTNALDELIDKCLEGKFTRTSRKGMFGNNVIIEYAVADLPTYVWSRGEKLLWDLLVSLSGRGCVNLAQLAEYFRGTDEWPLIISAIGALS